MPSTLLTGANSFVGAHVINSLIAAGHNVVGTVRRENLIDQIYATHPEWKEKLQVIVVKDYAEESSWDEVFAKHNLDHVRRRRLSFPSVATSCPSRSFQPSHRNLFLRRNTSNRQQCHHSLAVVYIPTPQSHKVEVRQTLILRSCAN